VTVQYSSPENPLITTVITTYRRPKLLKRAIESALSQTYPHLEIRVYDNASGDETREVVEAFMKKDARVKYHCHSGNIGMMGNYQYAFSQIKSPFFSLLSDDDCFLPWFYETALKGFQESPEAAFSACGTLMIDKNNQFVGDHLSLWKKEGHFAPSEAVLEMFNSGRFPAPLGVLFRTEKVNSIEPNFSKEIQVLWDVDYLVQIAARHPIIVNKKVCGVFLAHEQSFSFSFYQEEINLNKGLEVFLNGYQHILQHLLNNQDLSLEFKKKVRQSLIAMVRNDVGFMSILQCVQRRQIKKAISVIKLFQRFYGVDRRLIVYLPIVLVKVYMPIFWPLIKMFFASLKRMKAFLRGDFKFFNQPQNLKKHQEYLELIQYAANLQGRT
jgi:glycosyltransferase involved in cell wall biosynthesis